MAGDGGRCPECGTDAALCSRWRADGRRCCPECRHYWWPTPPGLQLSLLPRPLPTEARRWRVVTGDGAWRPWQRDLSMAALQAAAAAELDGESWLVADDESYVHLDADLILNPYTGWAVPASRAITSRRSTTP